MHRNLKVRFLILFLGMFWSHPGAAKPSGKMDDLLGTRSGELIFGRAVPAGSGYYIRDWHQETWVPAEEVEFLVNKDYYDRIQLASNGYRLLHFSSILGVGEHYVWNPEDTLPYYRRDSIWTTAKLISLLGVGYYWHRAEGANAEIANSIRGLNDGLPRTRYRHRANGFNASLAIAIIVWSAAGYIADSQFSTDAAGNRLDLIDRVPETPTEKYHRELHSGSNPQNGSLSLALTFRL
jgi:hypothetical protein